MQLTLGAVCGIALRSRRLHHDTGVSRATWPYLQDSFFNRPKAKAQHGVTMQNAQIVKKKRIWKSCFRKKKSLQPLILWRMVLGRLHGTSDAVMGTVYWMQARFVGTNYGQLAPNPQDLALLNLTT
jgi:hypothetical protein